MGVIHVGDEVHDMIKKHCAHNGLKMKEFAERVFMRAVKGNVSPPASVTRIDGTPVEERKSPIIPEPISNGPKPWEEPPFWEKEDREPARDMSNVFALPHR